MKSKVKNDVRLSFDRLVLVIIILIIIIWYYLKAFKKEKKIKELEALKEKIEENTKLENALKLKTKRTFFVIRIISIFSYFSINCFFYLKYCDCHSLCAHCIGNLLNYNTFISLMITALTFAMFGSFNAYRNWWRFLEIRIEAIIYRKSPDLKKIIKDDLILKEQIEKEIDDLRI